MSFQVSKSGLRCESLHILEDCASGVQVGDIEQVIV